MPIITTTKYGSATIVKTVSNSGAVTAVKGSVISASSRIDRPLPQSRLKPKDLFASRTPRYVASSEMVVICPRYKTQVSSSGITHVWDYAGTHQTWVPAISTNGFINQVLNEIKDQKVNLTVSIPELGKTTDMVVSLAKDVFSAFRNLRKGRFGNLVRGPRGASLSDRAAKRWLEYTYGIAPTMMEIYGLSEFIYHRITAPDEYIYVNKSFPLRFSRTNYNPNSYLLTEATCQGRYRYNVRYQVDSQGLLSLKQSGITNPAATIYELLPYSFVLDWVIDIGGYLSALDALVGLKNVQYGSGYKLDIKTIGKYQKSEPGWVHKDDGVFVCTERITNRLGNGLTNLTPELPTYDPHLGVRRMISAVALLKSSRLI